MINIINIRHFLKITIQNNLLFELLFFLQCLVKGNLKMKILRHRKLQTLMMFLVVMLCATLLTGSSGILISIEKPFEDFKKECKGPLAIFYGYDRSEKATLKIGKEFQKLDAVRTVEYTRYEEIKDDAVIFKGKKIDAFAKLTLYNEKVFGSSRYINKNKNIVKNLKFDECILPVYMNNDNKINKGEKIKVKVGNKMLIYKVKGFFADPFNTSGAFDSNILVKKLPKVSTAKLLINLYGKKNITGQDIEDAYREKHNGQMYGSMFTEKERIDNGLVAVRILGGILLAIGVIMLLVSGLIIHFMVKNAMLSEAKTIAIYKTIGYSSGDILKMYMKVYFLVITVACFIGIGASIFLSNTLLTNTFKSIGQVAGNNPILPGIFCYIGIVVFVLLIIYLIINKARKAKPVIVLTGMDFIGTKKKKYKGNSKLQFSSFGIAMRTLSRDKKNAISIIITCIMTIFSINFGIISLDIANTMKDNNDYWLGVDRCDVMIGVTDGAQIKNISKILNKDKRVKNYVKSALNDQVTINWKKGVGVTYMPSFAYDDFSKAKLPIVKGKNPSAGNEIAIGANAAKLLNKDVGDYIEGYLGGKKKVNMLITGIFQTYYEFGKACRISTKAYKENNYKYTYDNLSIYLKNPKDIDKFIKDIKNKIRNKGEVIKRTEKFKSIMDMISNPQQRAIPPVVVLVLLVAVINIFCIVLLKNMNGQRTNGIYKCIGYSTWHLVKANLWYVGVIAVVSLIAALPLTIGAYPYIMKTCLSMFGFIKYPVDYNFTHIALANTGAIIIFIVGTLLASEPLFRVSTRKLVQE
jgi:putative ABC transport system permease protein